MKNIIEKRYKEILKQKQALEKVMETYSDNFNTFKHSQMIQIHLNDVTEEIRILDRILTELSNFIHFSNIESETINAKEIFNEIFGDNKNGV